MGFFLGCSSVGWGKVLSRHSKERYLNATRSLSLHLDLRFQAFWSFRIVNRRFSAKSPSLRKPHTDGAGFPNILFLVRKTVASFPCDSISFSHLEHCQPELPRPIAGTA